MPLPSNTSSALFNSVGINIHLEYGLPSNYGNTPLVVSQMRDLGIKHVRAGLHSTVTGQVPPKFDFDCAYYGAWQRLGELGIRFNAVYDPRENLGVLSNVVLNTLWMESGMLIESLEGANEYDDSGIPQWQVAVAASQKALYGFAKTMTTGYGPLPVLGPSLGNAALGGQVGNLSAYLDHGNLHPYPGGQTPESMIAAQIEDAAAISGTKPVYASESGYHNAVNHVGWQPGVSELAAAKYTLRMILENFRQGIVRTYLYELQDEGLDPTDTNDNNAWGLVRYDGTYKPAFTAVKNLLSMLPNGNNPALAPVNYTLSGPQVSTLLLQQSSGTWLLFLWQPVSVYDLTTKADITSNPQMNVTLNLPVGTYTEIYEPLIQAGPKSIPSTNEVNLAISDHPTVVKIGK